MLAERVPHIVTGHSSPGRVDTSAGEGSAVEVFVLGVVDGE